MEKDWRKGVAVSYDSSLGCTFCCRSPRAGSPLPLYPTSCLYCWPMPLYGSCRQPISAEQVAHSNERVWETRRVGTANKNELHHTIQNNIAHWRARTHTHTKTNLPASLKQKKRCFKTTKQSNACKLYSAIQGALGACCSTAVKLFFGGKHRGWALGYYAEERR